jgi:hypothetical protein
MSDTEQDEKMNASDVRGMGGVGGTYPIVDVGTAADDCAIVHDADLAVHVQLLLDEVVLLGFWVAFPVLIRDLTAIQHSAVRNGIFAMESVVGLSLFDLLLKDSELAQCFFLLALIGIVVLLVSITILAHRWVNTFAHD